MIASSDSNSNQDQVGIIKNHAYSVISAYEFLNDGENTRLLKLRNPWGRGEWNGDWSDSSSLWTDELKSKLGWTGADDGIFFISFTDFLK